MSTIESVTTQMHHLEGEISRQQAYITRHGEKNDAGEYDQQWEQYKQEAQANLDKWDSLITLRRKLK